MCSFEEVYNYIKLGASIEEVKEKYGGQMLYIPKLGCTKEEIQEKHLAIKKRNEELVKKGENREARIIILNVEFPEYSKGYIDHII